MDDPTVLSVAATDETYDATVAPLWTYLDALTPNLWRSGQAYPSTGTAMFPLIADGELDLSISFSPGAASAAIANFELPETVRTFVLDKGTIGNASFVAIPYNSGSTEGAMIVGKLLDVTRGTSACARPQPVGLWHCVEHGCIDCRRPRAV